MQKIISSGDCETTYYKYIYFLKIFEKYFSLKYYNIANIMTQIIYTFEDLKKLQVSKLNL